MKIPTGPALTRLCLGASLLLHGAALGAAAYLRLPSGPALVPLMDVDLSAPFRPRRPGDTRLPGAAKGAPAPARRASPGGTGPRPPTLPPEDAEPGAPPSSAKPKEWVLPGSKTEKLEKPKLPAPTQEAGPVGARPGGAGPGGEGGRGGSGGGPGTGDALVNRPPRLVNREEILASLRRQYPESERRAGREGVVELALEIDADGSVRGARVLGSAGPAFDQAALSVARRMLFEPALAGSVPTAAAVRQRMQFRLGD